VENLSRLAYCGLYCGGCRNFQENMNCQGCRDEVEMVSDCPTKVCAVRRGFLHCGECAEFPCAELNTFYNDGVRHHAMAYENIQSIKSTGLTSWLAEQDKKYICQCGKKLYWFEDRCKDHS